MDFWKSIWGLMEVELLCADPAFVLKQITGLGIPIYRTAERTDGFGIRFTILRNDYRKVLLLSKKYGYECGIQRRIGVYWHAKRMVSRPVLVVGIILFMALTLYLPSRVLFFQVEGNHRIPSKRILQACNEAGVGFWSDRNEVRSERVKNALLEQIQELKWAGINTRGCVAVITVKERLIEEKPVSGQVSSIVASTDGIISSCTATKGNMLVKPGQAVTCGEVLISGYTDCGLSIRATRAEGEVYARTNREMTAVLPNAQQTKGEILREETKYSLVIGKNRINFYKGSGILGDSCDKMYTEYVLTLPGGFVLPVSLIAETWRVWDSVEESITEETARFTMEQCSKGTLNSVMIAGNVLNSVSQMESTEQLYTLTTKYFCHEMIGQVRYEENVLTYGK